MHRGNYVAARYLHVLDVSDSTHSYYDITARSWFLSLLGTSTEEAQLCLHAFTMDFEYGRHATAQSLTIKVKESVVARGPFLAAADIQIPAHRLPFTPIGLTKEGL